MKLSSLLAATALAAGIAAAAPAQADPFKFVITGDYNATFFLDSSPTPDVAFSYNEFILWDVPGFADAALGVADIYFYNSQIGGGMEIDDFYGGTTLLSTDGPQVYKDDENTPTFLTGTYAMTEYGGGPGTYTLTISAVSAGVPEPAAWGMMIGGFGLAGMALRRRGDAKRTAKVNYAG